MLATLIRKELTDHVFSLRFYLSFALCFLFMTAGIAVLARGHVQDIESLGPYLNPDQYRQITERGNAVALLNGGVSLSRSLPPLKSVCTGLDDLSLIATLKGAEEPAFRRRAFVANPIPDLFPRFDLVFIVGAVVSLIAINFTYDAICGEKQSGTLRLTLAGSVPRHLVLLGKLIGGYLAFLVGYLPSMLMVCLLLTLTPEIPLGGSEWGVLGGVFLLSLLYAAAFFTLGLWVSTQTASPATSLVTLLAAWAALVLVVPSLSPYLAARLAPADSPEAVEARISAIRMAAARRGWDETLGYLRANGLPHRFEIGGETYDDWNPAWGSWVDAVPRVIPQVSDSVAASRFLQFSTEVVRRQFLSAEADVLQVRQAHVRSLERQMTVGLALSCLSPLGVFTHLVTDLSGTGVQSERRFRRAVDRFKRDIVSYVGRQLSERTLFDRLDAAAFPAFQYRAQEDSGRVAFYILLLVGFQAVFLLMAHVAFCRYDVR